MTERKNPGAGGAAAGGSESVQAERLNTSENTPSCFTTQVRLGEINETPDLQMREAGVDPATVQEYAEAMESGAEFPPVTLYRESDTFWPADGFHRIAAAKKLGRETIAAKVIDGTRRDAILHAAGANASHGLRRTQAD